MTATTETEMAISDKLDKIKKKAAALNTKTDDLNVTIVAIEDQLRGSGVEYWWHRKLEERISGPDEGSTGRERDFYVLGYAKVGTEWGLAIREESDTELDYKPSRAFEDSDYHSHPSGDPVPLTRAPRKVRIAAADVLEEFLDAFLAQLGKMEAALDKANTLMADADPDIDPELKRKVVADRLKRQRR
jgi:hypothetical protein